MIVIEHRCNSIERLKNVPLEVGCEIDLRNHGKQIIVAHDAFDENGEELSLWLEHYRNRFLILNVKEEGLEECLFPLLKKFKVDNFFILDESVPFIRKWALKGIPNFALRVSEIECHTSALLLAEDLKIKGVKIDWIWADCFNGKPLAAKQIMALKEFGYKICYVSPELHHIESPHLWKGMVIKFRLLLSNQKISPDAICTKLPEYWLSSSVIY